MRMTISSPRLVLNCVPAWHVWVSAVCVCVLVVCVCVGVWCVCVSVVCVCVSVVCVCVCMCYVGEGRIMKA